MLRDCRRTGNGKEHRASRAGRTLARAPHPVAEPLVFGVDRGIDAFALELLREGGRSAVAIDDVEAELTLRGRLRAALFARMG